MVVADGSDQVWEEARREVLAAITRQARGVAELQAEESARLLELLARAVTVLKRPSVGASVGQGDVPLAEEAEQEGGLQMLGAAGETRAGGHKVGLALELEQ